MAVRIAHHDAAMLARAPDHSTACQLQLSAGKYGSLVPRSKRGQAIHRLDEVQGNLVERQVGIDGDLALGRANRSPSQRPPQRAPKLGNALALQGQSGSHWMAAAAIQHLSLCGDGGVDVDPLYRARRSTCHLALWRAEDDGRLDKALGQPASDDADDARVPGGTGDNDRRAIEERSVAIQLCQGRVGRLAGQPPAPRVQRLQRGGDRARPRPIAGGQQFDTLIGSPLSSDAAEGVQTRSKGKANILFAQRGRVQASQLEHGAQTEALCPPQHVEAALQQIAHIATQRRHIGDDTQGNQVEEPAGILLPGTTTERTHHLVGHTDARQFIERVIRRQSLGVDHGKRIGQPLPEVVVIGDQHIHTLSDSQVHGSVCVHAGIGREQ